MKKLPSRGFTEEAFVSDFFALFVDGEPYQVTINAPKDDGEVFSFTIPAMSKEREAVEAMQKGIGKGEVREVQVLVFPKVDAKVEDVIPKEGSLIIVPSLVGVRPPGK